MNAPIVWRRTAAKFKVQQMLDDYFKRIIDIIQNDFIVNDLFCKSVGLANEPVSVEMYISEMYGYLWDFKSIIIMDEYKNDIVGFMILHTVDKSYTEPRAPDPSQSGSELYGFVLGLKTAAKRGTHLFKEFDCEEVLMFEIMHIVPQYRHHGLGSVMFDVACIVARQYNIPVVACITTTYSLQHMAATYHMKEMQFVSYWCYVDENIDLDISSSMGINKACKFFAGRLPPEPLPPPLPIEPKQKPKKEKGKKSKKGKKK